MNEHHEFLRMSEVEQIVIIATGGIVINKFTDFSHTFSHGVALQCFQLDFFTRGSHGTW